MHSQVRLLVQPLKLGYWLSGYWVSSDSLSATRLSARLNVSHMWRLALRTNGTPLSMIGRYPSQSVAPAFTLRVHFLPGRTNRIATSFGRLKRLLSGSSRTAKKRNRKAILLVALWPGATEPFNSFIFQLKSSIRNLRVKKKCFRGVFCVRTFLGTITSKFLIYFTWYGSKSFQANWSS